MSRDCVVVLRSADVVPDLTDRLSAVDAAMNFQNHSKETMADAEEATEAARTQVTVHAFVSDYSVRWQT